MPDERPMLRFSTQQDHTTWSLPPMQLYARFRSKSAITALKQGPRGGLLAKIDGEWKRVRKTRQKTRH